MPSDLLPALFSNVWNIFLVVLFFGGSIFVHELGHFLAARRRGVHVARFSIGFGPKIFSWTGRDGVEYRLSWFPLGGYVALPQLADMRGIEGESDVDVAQLPPLSYATKMIVFVAGAAFNVLFAFLLAAIIWFIGQPQSSEMSSTRIGHVIAELELPNGTRVTSPAAQAGLQAGDIVRAIDGRPVKDWTDLMHTLITGAGRTPDGRPQSIFSIERDGKISDFVLHPQLSGDEGIRRVGVAPGYELVVYRVAPASIAEQVGLRAQDEILSANGTRVLNAPAFLEQLAADPAKSVTLRVRRGDRELALTLPPRAGKETTIGVDFTTRFSMVHLTPIEQISEHIAMTFRTLWSLLHPQSDIGLSKMSGPVGIVHIFHDAAQAGIRAILIFTILININLAIFNLLPIPVLDGGHMLFATIARLRGRALPMNFVMTAQSVFMVLLFSMVLYVSFFDVRRWKRDARAERAEAAAPTKP